MSGSPWCRGRAMGHKVWNCGDIVKLTCVSPARVDPPKTMSNRMGSPSQSGGWLWVALGGRVWTFSALTWPQGPPGSPAQQPHYICVCVPPSPLCLGSTSLRGPFFSMGLCCIRWPCSPDFWSWLRVDVILSLRQARSMALANRLTYTL